jgi:hypothetical protein
MARGHAGSRSSRGACNNPKWRSAMSHQSETTLQRSCLRPPTRNKIATTTKIDDVQEKDKSASRRNRSRLQAVELPNTISIK